MGVVGTRLTECSSRRSVQCPSQYWLPYFTLSLTGLVNAPVAGLLNAKVAGLLNALVAGLLNAPVAGLFNTPVAGLFNTPVAGLFNTPLAGLLRTGSSRAMCRLLSSPSSYLCHPPPPTPFILPTPHPPSLLRSG